MALYESCALGFKLKCLDLYLEFYPHTSICLLLSSVSCPTGTSVSTSRVKHPVFLKNLLSSTPCDPVSPNIFFPYWLPKGSTLMTWASFLKILLCPVYQTSHQVLTILPLIEEQSFIMHLDQNWLKVYFNFKHLSDRKLD